MGAPRKRGRKRRTRMIPIANHQDIFLQYVAPLATTATTAARLYKTVKNVKQSKKIASEKLRHDIAIDNIAREGKGLSLKSYKRGKGLKKKRRCRWKQQTAGELTEFTKDIKGFLGIYMRFFTPTPSRKRVCDNQLRGQGRTRDSLCSLQKIRETCYLFSQFWQCKSFKRTGWLFCQLYHQIRQRFVSKTWPNKLRYLVYSIFEIDFV